MRVLVLLTVVLASLIVTAAPAGAVRTKRVTIADVDFSPATVKIRRGDRVRWTWKDDPTPHNVRSRGSRRFKGSSTKTEGSHTVRFRRRGTYRYVCTVHLNMSGRVIVR